MLSKKKKTKKIKEKFWKKNFEAKVWKKFFRQKMESQEAQPPAAAAPPGVDINVLSNHVLNATQLLLDTNNFDNLAKAVKDKGDLIRKFASDSACRGEFLFYC